MKFPVQCLSDCNKGKHCFCRMIKESTGLDEFVTGSGETSLVCCRCGEKIGGKAITHDEEPIIHSHLTDELPESHPLAYECVHCKKCLELVHASNNECMQTWIEYKGNQYCTKCFPITNVLEERDDT